ncbi:MAG: sulfatase-like hydrolase/transferase [Akkermansiaceae bacterium]|nr:sulfatase-like hydrolase/transferase [Akkermansiaceae bacterium]
MKPLSALILVGGIILTVTSFVAAEKSASPPPNIILILADDLGHGDLSYNGCQDIKTPHLDKLAGAGLILNDHHTTASVCAPSRAGLMSGKYQQHFGFECNGPHGKFGLPGSVVTYAEAMKAAGYETMGLGKWHLGSQPEMHPNAQGFDHFSGFIAGGRSYFPEKKINAEQMMQRNGKQVPEPEIKYVTNWLTDEAIRLIDHRQKDKPFLMYLSYNAPHTPMHALEEDLALYRHIDKKNRRTYAAMVHNMDQNIGRLRRHLEENQLSDNTMVIFCSDNGGATTNASDNGIYRGMKGSKWEGGHRVPCIIHWPAGGLTGGKRIGMLTSTLDFMATSLDVAGRKEQIKALGLDGVSLLPGLQNISPSKGHDTLYFRRSVAAAVRDGNWKLIRVENEDLGHRFLLFDLARDIGETKDLAKQHPERVQQLAAKLATWEKGIQAPAWREGKKWESNQRKKHHMDVIGREAERKLP